MKITKLFIMLFIAGGVTNCANMFKYQPYARSVKKSPGQGGIIALELNYRAEDQEKATQLMNSNCGVRRPQILEEGEVVVGSVTKSQAENEAATKRNVGSLFGVPVTSGHDGQINTSSETIQKKEWQLKYKCV